MLATGAQDCNIEEGVIDKGPRGFRIFVSQWTIFDARHLWRSA